ncbi:MULTISPECIES: response regulator [unclassified Pseudomonas]|uniref:response regulator n=1 Tax=unclassified Pseudomonas TaxID=196821 RepID=UPI000BC3B061|nr:MULTISPECIES: response regulator [unclassified Pseudomonas]PVZ12665.1 LuxR family two component transcriptional regulator [Pseudomonas sp. URIL14HWK12:I12]PVZ23184.1 LuxR family two component transcriptional regulator [Pseudomonas sp. URIL14HWK12:I10]PVZ32513.1 LuxR family two component transcriptional regulator [Pseudomonas sp. URIL14HWK12:I11]SNZ13574.1 two component transcriptional regulator, LuxR family [Pseudomonas sp. URIL14HWK12:I9]
MPELNVVIADDHPIVLLGVRELVQRDERYRIVGEAMNSTGLVQQMHTHRPEVLITDFNMPGDETYGDGLKLIDYLLRHFPGTHVLVLTMVSNTLILTRLQELGVAGVIQKSHLHSEIDNALNALSAQRIYKSLMASPQSVMPSTQQVQERFQNLSPREIEVLRLFVTGLSVSDIARQLSRSVKTVSAQKVAAMRKLEVDSDQALLTYCIEARQFQ